MLRRRVAEPDLNRLYFQMALIRHFEESIAGLWRKGLISGELHLGLGEEAIAAGVVSHLGEGDAIAADHRSTPPFVASGVRLEAMVLELLGSEEGLCRGRGGHMHLFEPERLAASSGIVGASAPLACGFALAAQHLRPGKAAVAFFGEGAFNQGMVMEALNLSVAWKLPVVFVCKDNRWAITTVSRGVTGGSLLKRARAFGMPAAKVNGARVDTVWLAAGTAVNRARRGLGPSLILARCPRLEGHFLGDPLLRVLREPVQQAKEITGPLVRAAARTPGSVWSSRAASMGRIGRAVSCIAMEQFVMRNDPMKTSGRLLNEETRRGLEQEAADEVARAVRSALGSMKGGAVG